MAKSNVASGGMTSGVFNAPPPPNATTGRLLDEVRDSLDVALNSLHPLVEEVRSFADGVHGAAPSPGPSNVAEPSTARAYQVMDRLRWLHASLDTLREEVARLRAI